MNRLTAVLFVGVLCTPALLHFFTENSTTYISFTERRNVEPLPKMPVSLDELSDYPAKVSAHLDDHFGLRRGLLENYGQLMFGLGVSMSPEVTLGKDGWLFYDGNNINNAYRGRHPFSEEKLIHWTSQFLAYQSWLEDRDIPLLLVAIPEKQEVKTEFLPDWLERGAATRLDQLTEHILQNELDLPILDLKNDLIAGEIERSTYYKTDTHWNDYGGFIAYQAIMNRLSETFPELEPKSDVTFSLEERTNSDLARFIYIPDYEEPFHYVAEFKDPIDSTIETMRKADFIFEPASYERAKRASNIAHFESPLPDQPKVLLIRDSFGSYLLKYFAATFQDLWVAPHTGMQEYHEDLIERVKPDVVIYAFAERQLNVQPKQFGNPFNGIEFGISMAQQENESVPNSKELVVSFWTASTKELRVNLVVNEKLYGLNYTAHPEIDTQYPNHPHKSGYEGRIPNADLKDENNSLKILVNGLVFREMHFSIAP